MQHAFLCEGLRTPIGRFGGALASVRPDTLLGDVIRSLMNNAAALNPESIDDVFIGCANQAGEDNRNVARMAVLLAGLPVSVPAVTINRLCGSGLDAVGMAARSITAGDADVIIAGGVESMTRAPMVMPKADSAFSRNAEIYDTTIGWRFVNTALKKAYGIDSMPETAENVAAEFGISREDQDFFAYRSQTRAAQAMQNGRLAIEIQQVEISHRNKETVVFDSDEHPRATSIEKLASLSTPFKTNGCVTAGNASGVNDGAAAVIVASENGVEKYNLNVKARITGMATAGVEPRIMGIGPAPATQKLLAKQQLGITDIDIIELNEAFAAQALAVTRQLGLPDEADHVNPNGGAIALGHPLGMSGTRLALTAATELQQQKLKRALCTMCIGVGQGIALTMERPS